ncbi:MAG TPA: hypothetical protein IAC96_06875 [Candidatus Fimimorpha faecalis]|uniref:Uncharacterized protein n=1 Tax=Candidatus Fimimorpha faecalis TaxID=2840824 RepID=A0A9D1EE11_9FIRM|nr:hypothetical protein [Candidatus Fimimorpha faecalis]
MKRWYKKVNRGLVLAMILIVGLVSYITVGTIQFNQQKESAKELIENYMEAVMKFAVDKRASNIQAEQLMGTYWEKKEMRLQDGGMDKEVFQMQMDQFLEEKNENLEQLSGIMTDYQINKYGTNGALCKIEYNYDFTLSGETVVILPTGIEVISKEVWTEYGLETDQKAKRNEQLSANVYLTLTDDGWKIVRITIDRYMVNNMTAA